MVKKFFWKKVTRMENFNFFRELLAPMRPPQQISQRKKIPWRPPHRFIKPPERSTPHPRKTEKSKKKIEKKAAAETLSVYNVELFPFSKVLRRCAPQARSAKNSPAGPIFFWGVCFLNKNLTKRPTPAPQGRFFFGGNGPPQKKTSTGVDLFVCFLLIKQTTKKKSALRGNFVRRRPTKTCKYFSPIFPSSLGVKAFSLVFFLRLTNSTLIPPVFRTSQRMASDSSMSTSTLANGLYVMAHSVLSSLSGFTQQVDFQALDGGHKVQKAGGRLAGLPATSWRDGCRRRLACRDKNGTTGDRIWAPRIRGGRVDRSKVGSDSIFLVTAFFSGCDQVRNSFGNWR